jgi:hypothetical protein
MRPTLRRPRRAGVSIVEVAVASAIFAGVIAVASASGLRAQSSWAAASARNGLERRAAAALDRLTELLEDVPMSAIADDLSPAAAASSITFRKKSGWTSGAVSLGPLTTIAWESDTNDPPNGKDDDRDGLVDEGVVTLVSNDGSVVRRTVLAVGVAGLLQGEKKNGLDDNGNGIADERGLSIVQDGGRIVLRLTMAGRAPDGALMFRTVEGSVAPRE